MASKPFFENILGSYVKLPKIRHDMFRNVTYLFLGDRWEYVGDIQCIFHRIDAESGYIEVSLPNIDLFIAAHPEIGAEEWYEWGPMLN